MCSITRFAEGVVTVPSFHALDMCGMMPVALVALTRGPLLRHIRSAIDGESDTLIMAVSIPNCRDIGAGCGIYRGNGGKTPISQDFVSRHGARTGNHLWMLLHTGEDAIEATRPLDGRPGGTRGIATFVVLSAFAGLLDFKPSLCRRDDI